MRSLRSLVRSFKRRKKLPDLLLFDLSKIKLDSLLIIKEVVKALIVIQREYFEMRYFDLTGEGLEKTKEEKYIFGLPNTEMTERLFIESKESFNFWPKLMLYDKPDDVIRSLRKKGKILAIDKDAIH